MTLTFVSFQGFFVSVFYCFLNSEVSTGGAWGVRAHPYEGMWAQPEALPLHRHPGPQLKAFAELGSYRHNHRLYPDGKLVVPWLCASSCQWDLA